MTIKSNKTLKKVSSTIWKSSFPLMGVSETQNFQLIQKKEVCTSKEGVGLETVAHAHGVNFMYLEKYFAIHQNFDLFTL